MFSILVRAMRLATPIVVALVLGTGPCQSPLEAQGRTDYFNVESPQVHPIEVAEFAGEDLLFVCNTPDNSVEIYSTDESLPAEERFLQRVPVGLEPITVRVDGDRFYTANFLGDSITVARLELTGDGVVARVERTAFVGDEPMDIAFVDGANSRELFVTQHSSSSVGWFNAQTLEPAFPARGSEQVDLVQSSGSPPFAVKEPRAVRVRDGRLFTLGFKGGVTHPDSLYDLDLLIADVAGPPVFDTTIAGLGTHNFNMEFAANGDLYIIGGEAQSFDNDTKVDVRNEVTGFVQSTVYRITGPVDEGSVIWRRDLNRVTPDEVAAPEIALAMPTEVVLYEPSGELEKLFVTAFSSDRIGVLEPDSDVETDPDIGGWTRRVIDYSSDAPVGGKPRWGPRGMTVRYSSEGDRLYVLNRIDHSVSVFDPALEVEIESFPLQLDPTPGWIAAGRHFLYSADLSGNGFVSCASCHLDGRTDGLSWRLGNPEGIPPVEDPVGPDAIFFNLAGPSGENDRFVLDMLAASSFDPDGVEDKREQITQSMQGLVNFEVEPIAEQYFSNAPYHWRGDKPGFLDFNEAFVTLMLSDDVNPGGIGGPKGVSDEEMAQFEEFIFSIQHPPNPQQPIDRLYSSGVPGGLLGQELFHSAPIDRLGRGRSCVHCHAPPDGSINRTALIQTALPIPGYTATETVQPFEPGMLRSLLQREGLLQRSGFDQDNLETTPRTAHFGISHNGTRVFADDPNFRNPPLSINSFVDSSALTFGIDYETGRESDELVSIKQFVHEFDWSVAPIVGRSITITIDNFGDAAVRSSVALITGQGVETNAGVAAHGLIAGEIRGFWYHNGENRWVEEPGGERFTLGTLLDLLTTPEDRVTLIATPLGSERRVASPTGRPELLAGDAPVGVELLPATVIAANEGILQVAGNWLPPDAPAPYTPAPEDAFVFDGRVGAPFLKTMRLFQYGILDSETDYGLPAPRHEAPRRFAVAGDSIQPGARLILSVPNPPLDYAGIDPIDAVEKGDFPTLEIALPVFATGQQTPDGRAIWETAVEVDAKSLYVLMLGGVGAPGMVNTGAYTVCSAFDICGSFGFPDPAPIVEPTIDSPDFDSPYDPDRWNWHFVEVENPDGQVGVGGWHQLRLDG